jgi:hypothetical protein
MKTIHRASVLLTAVLLFPQSLLAQPAAPGEFIAA